MRCFDGLPGVSVVVPSGIQLGGEIEQHFVARLARRPPTNFLLADQHSGSRMARFSSLEIQPLKCFARLITFCPCGKIRS